MSVSVIGGPLEWDAVINNSQFKKQIDEMHAKMVGFNKSVEKQASDVDVFFRKTAAALAGYVSVMGGANLVRNIVQVRGEIQALETSFTVLLQSKEKADRLMEEVVQFAATTPFGLQEVAGATKQLLAFGLEASQIEGTLRSLGDVAAGLGQPLGEIAYLYGTIKTAGKANAVDLKQFAQRGIPIYSELAKVLKIGTDEIDAMVSAGKIGFPEIEAAFQSMTAKGSQFGGMMEEQSKTILGLQSNLKDAIDQMFNDLGKGQDGLITGTIQTAITVVENYQKVIDVLKVATVTFGAYKAATIAASVATGISAAATRGWTVAEMLRFKAMQLSTKAMQILNATMLTNPWVLTATAVTALVAALVVFNSTASESVKVQERLNGISGEAQKSILAEKNKLEQLLSIARDETQSKDDRLTAIKRINQISPQYLKNLTLENLKTQEGVDLINQYVKALESKAKAQAAENAITKIDEERISAQVELDNKIQERLKGVPESYIETFKKSDPVIRGLIEANSEYNKSLDKQAETIKRTYSEELKKQALQNQQTEAEIRTIAVIDEKIKKAKEDQAQKSSTAKEYQQFQEKINALEKERLAITGKSTKQITKDLNEQKKKLEDFHKDLKDTEDAVRQAGLTQEKAELDRINAKYDELLQKAKEVGASPEEVERVQILQSKELTNLITRRQNDVYFKSLEDQKSAFERYENAKREYGIENAKKMYAGQIQGFDNYLEYLDAEMSKAFASRNTLEGKLKLEGLGKEYVEAEKQMNEQAAAQREREFADALDKARTFNSERIRLEREYEQQRIALKMNYAGDDLEERLRALDDAHEKEMEALRNYGQKYAGVFEKLNEDVTFYTKERLKEQKAALEKYLADNPGIPPALVKQIEQVIKQIEDLSKVSARGVATATNFQKIAQAAGEIGGSIGSAADAVRELNPRLADTLDQLAGIAAVAGKAANAITQFASGNIIGGIAGTIDTIFSVFGMNAKAKAEQQRRQQELKEFQTQAYTGEQEINMLYRERAREQIRINKLRLEGIAAERNLLEQQLKDNQRQAAELIQLLSKESYKVIRDVMDPLGRTVQRTFMETIGDRPFAELEEMFTKGQLEGRAKELFQSLQKLQQEGIDIAKTMEDARKETQEILTGTTADSITDSIVQGFANGYRSVQDFAANTEELIRGAMLNALKYRFLEGPINKLFDQFAADAESGDGLDTKEVADFTAGINKTVEEALKYMEQVQQATGINLNNVMQQANSLKGGIQAQITEQTGTVLSGQMGNIMLTARQQLDVATRQLNTLNLIKEDTTFIRSVDQRLQRLELHGIKIKA